MAKSGFIYGTAPNVNSTAEILKKYNTIDGKSYWNTAYSEITKNYNNGLYQLDNELSTNMAKQNYGVIAAKNSAAGAGISSGDIKRYNDYYDNALEQAYTSYKNNYNESLSALHEQASNAYDVVNSALNTQARNVTDLSNFGYDFISDLADRDTSPFYDENGNLLANYAYLFDENAVDDIGRNKLLTRSQLNEKLYDSNTGVLNERGMQFYDMIFNGDFNGERYTDYLQKNNPELLEWAASYNQYDDSGLDNWNYVKKELMDITDDKYLLGNYLNYMSEEERNNILFTANDDMLQGLIANNDTLSDEQKTEYYRIAGVNPNTGKRITSEDSDIVKFVTDNGATIRNEYSPINAYALNTLNDDLLATRLKSEVRLTDGTGEVWYLEDKNSDEFKYVKQVINDIANGLIADGDVIDLDKGGKTALYMVKNGQLVPVKDFKDSTVNDVSYDKYISYKKIDPNANYIDFVRSSVGQPAENWRSLYDIPKDVTHVLPQQKGMYYWDAGSKKWIKAKPIKKGV